MAAQVSWYGWNVYLAFKIIKYFFPIDSKKCLAIDLQKFVLLFTLFHIADWVVGLKFCFLKIIYWQLGSDIC